MRRAFPQIEMTVFTLAGISASPWHWRMSTRQHRDRGIQDQPNRRDLIRNASMNLGLANSFASYSMTAGTARTVAIQGSLTYATEVGRLLRAIQVGPDRGKTCMRSPGANAFRGGRSSISTVGRHQASRGEPSSSRHSPTGPARCASRFRTRCCSQSKTGSLSSPRPT
ncbi:DUF917 family protein [Microbacterium oxydans]|nr:DUF917 family protein [Microbacterium oxydans]